MMLIEHIINISTNCIINGSIINGFFIVLLESFVPILPLSAFVAFNVNSFGFFRGVLLSWAATCIGSYLCYRLFFLINDRISKIFISKKMYNMIDRFNNISFSELVLLLTLPFTPSFLINVLAGISKMSSEKFCFSIMIGKCFSIIFWGYIGKSIIEDVTNVYSLLFIIMIVFMAYVISKIINNHLQIE